MSQQNEKVNDAPRHAYEVTIRIGANSWEFVLDSLHRLLDHIEEHGENCSLVSGGWDGSYYVDIQKRSVSPEQFRDELEQWRQTESTLRKADSPVSSAP